MKFTNTPEKGFEIDVPELNNLLSLAGNGFKAIYMDLFGARRRIETIKLAGDLEVSCVDGTWSINKLQEKLTFVEKSELIKFENRINIIEESYKRIQQDKEAGKQITYSDPKKDWSSMFLDYSQYVSEEKLRELWAELLKKELLSESSGSKKTLEIMKNLNKEEIEVILRLKQYETNICYIDTQGKVFENEKEGIEGIDDISDFEKDSDTFIYGFKGDDDLRECNIDVSFMELKQLSSIGVLDTTNTVSYFSEGCIILTNGQYLYRNCDVRYSFPAWGLTREGKEIFSLLQDKVVINEEYIQHIESRTGFKRFNTKEELLELLPDN